MAKIHDFLDGKLAVETLQCLDHGAILDPFRNFAVSRKVRLSVRTKGNAHDSDPYAGRDRHAAGRSAIAGQR